MIGDFIPPASSEPRAFRKDREPARIGQESIDDLSLIHLDSGGDALAACLCCPDVPCARFDEEESSIALRLDLTRDPSRDVCAFGAITIGRPGTPPLIDPEACASCGLCVNRCPVGAIAWTSTGVAHVQVDADDVTEQADLATHYRARQHGADVVERVELGDAEWPTLRTRFDQCVDGLRPGELRLLVRNLLRGLGLPAHSGVRGDTSDRTEIAFEEVDLVGLGEIEAKADLLEAVRRLMTAVAVTHARRGIAREALAPVVFMLRMPNKRTDGYELMLDLTNVLGLEVAVIPIAALQVAMLGSAADAMSSLLQVGCLVHHDPAALDIGSLIADALDVPHAATHRFAAFTPPK